jgi:hypothetical protein
MPRNIHAVMQYAKDVDDAPFAGAKDNEVSTASSLACDMQQRHAWLNVVPTSGPDDTRSIEQVLQGQGQGFGIHHCLAGTKFSAVQAMISAMS